MLFTSLLKTVDCWCLFGFVSLGVFHVFVVRFE
uniref:Uncharacterized protein LOC103499392 n=1 Tax=Rhizophora mucronata TaxID=61149 RepID=A0A2P2Q4W0_RHIMU